MQSLLLLIPFSLCTILKSPPVPTLKIHPRLSPFSFAHDFKISPCSPDSSHSASQLALFLILKDEYYFRHFCAEKVALPPHPIHIWDARESNLPSRKWFLFLNLRTHGAVPFSSAFSDEYTTANLSACDRDRQRPFSMSNRISHISKKWLSARSTPSN